MHITTERSVYASHNTIGAECFTDPYFFQHEDELLIVRLLAEVPEALIGGEDFGFSLDEEAHWFLNAHNHQVITTSLS